jgi:hypothetical protein
MERRVQLPSLELPPRRTLAPRDRSGEYLWSRYCALSRWPRKELRGCCLPTQWLRSRSRRCVGWYHAPPTMPLSRERIDHLRTQLRQLLGSWEYYALATLSPRRHRLPKPHQSPLASLPNTQLDAKEKDYLRQVFNTFLSQLLVLR